MMVVLCDDRLVYVTNVVLTITIKYKHKELPLKSTSWLPARQPRICSVASEENHRDTERQGRYHNKNRFPVTMPGRLRGIATEG